jgi:hypoxanthine phosphoribosyltransferase
MSYIWYQNIDTLILTVVSLVSIVYIGYITVNMYRAAYKDNRIMPEELPPAFRAVPLKKLLLGIHDLAEYARAFNPSWIVGVHPGGRLLSVYIADKLSIPLERCLFAHTEPEHISEILVRGLKPDQELSGPVLVIDDIARTGNTLRAVQAHFRYYTSHGTYKISRHLYAVLLLVDREKEMVFVPDWYKFTTKVSFIKFPWSPLSEKIRHELVQRTKGFKVDERYLALHEKMAEDPKIALQVAKMAIEASDRFEELFARNALPESILRPEDGRRIGASYH